MTDSRVALISGGARGIGRALALTLGREGWAIAVCYRSSEDDARSLLASLHAQGARALAVQADVSDPTQASGLIATVEGAYGSVDALINAAGPFRRVPLLDETVEGWRAMFDNNLHPVFYLTRAAAPGMKARGWGRVVNFGVANADQHVGQPGVTGYVIAKEGVLSLTRSFARVLAPFNVTVNAVSPGYITSGGSPEEELTRALPTIPAGYLGSTDDVVSAVRYLLSDEARYVNGANLHVSGAWGV